MAAVQSISASGVIVSIGHSDATFEQMQQAAQLGATQGHTYTTRCVHSTIEIQV